MFVLFISRQKLGNTSTDAYTVHFWLKSQKKSAYYIWPITDCSILYATGVKRIQSVVLRRIGVRSNFRSRDKDGGHTIRSTIAENPMLYANFTTLSFIEPSYCRVNFYIAEIGNFAFFEKKIVQIINLFCSHPKKYIAITETRSRQVRKE